MERKNDEQMIYVKDLIFAALYRWRAVLAVALILALALGGYKAVNTMSASEQVSEAAIVRYQEEMAAKEQQVTQLQSTIKSQQTYLEESVLMRLNPYGFYEAVLKVYVLTDYKIQPELSYQDPDKTDSVLNAYQTALQGDAALQAYAQPLKVDSRYVAELMTVNQDAQADTLELRIKCRTQEEAQALVKAMDAQLTAANPTINANVAQHSVSILVKDARAQVDPTLVDAQKKEATRITDLNKSLTEAKTALAGLKKPEAWSKSAALEGAVVFAVLGAVLGAFLTVCLVAVGQITGGKVYACRSLRSRTGIKVIGAVESAPRKCGIDRLLRKLEGRSAGQEDLAAVATNISCRAEGAKRLLITGVTAKEDREVLLQSVTQAMPGTQVEDAGALTQAQGLEALKACDAVVLVVKCGQSRYDAVVQQMELIADYNKQLIGCVVLDG